MPPEEKSSLGKLEEKLYSPNQPVSFEVPKLSTKLPETPTSEWAPPPMPKPRKRISFAVWFLIFAAVFSLIAMGIAAFFLFAGIRTVSSDKIDITFNQGATNIASGTTVPFTITVKNRNPADISNTDVTIDFPDGTRSAADVTQPLVRDIETLGSVPAGGTKSLTVQAVLFGSVNQTLTIPVTFEYHTANSNQIFTKKVNYSFTITSSPLTITTKSVTSAASGQPFAITVAVRSNATSPLENVAVSAQYPTGYSSQRSGSATSTGPLFMIGTLKPGEEKDLTFNGSLTGNQNDQRTFQFTVGTPKDDGSPTLGVAYASAQNTVTVTSPFLSAMLSLNNNSNDPLVVNAGQPISGIVSWTNTLAAGITNGQVSIRLSGNALSSSNVTASNGYYDSAHSTIVFSRDTEATLSHLKAGDTGQGSFGIGLKSGSAFTSLRNPSIVLTVGVSGTPDDTNTHQAIAASLTRSIRIATDLVLTSSILHSTGPIQNTGAWPPLVNAPTTYTVQLKATNDVNDVAGATATMILPSYVTFTSKTSVSSGTITYDDATRTVTWKIGDIPAGTIAKPLQAAFQISFLPSSSQVGQTPILIQNQSISGTDRFASTDTAHPYTVQYTAPALSTSAVADPGFQPQFGSVAN